MELIFSYFKVVSTNDIRGIAPEARNCYFDDEMDLIFYEKYTFINCQLECAILEVETMLRCTPWHLPKVTDIFVHIIEKVQFCL